ncbi:hypothetical protein SCLCIDRAFT_1206584 [Scleroderma citrinum Foug A]|uniref:Uncharacterized protein n=1 Tax=Scleroderma citrinum Foug A TaxID=1036808 RepID=A0A0C3A9N1_9AGAM|nr:hypothetical protein SCLCIDRAFT_1206584 [Scleroderma citrinum Foug A]
MASYIGNSWMDARESATWRRCHLGSVLCKWCQQPSPFEVTIPRLAREIPITASRGQ